jgi:threonine/homoserine/homoserine lactone efflux protein
VFDSRYLAYASISALLVISPGATMAVVMETVLGEGRAAALLTVVGINIGNSTLALTSALGMAFVFHAWPGALQAVRIAGAIYLAYLGVRGLSSAAMGRRQADVAWRRSLDEGGQPDVTRRATPTGAIGRGVMTNLLNPPVVLFYMTFLPQFIGPQDPFFTRFLVLAATHVGMSLAWLSAYAFALGVLADRFARPAVRRTLDGLTGLLLVAFGMKMVLQALSLQL